MYVWLADLPPALPPSPKSHTYMIGSPSGSRPEAENRTLSGAPPPAGSAAICTVGAWLPGGLPTTIDTVAVPVMPPGSRAVTVAV